MLECFRSWKLFLRTPSLKILKADLKRLDINDTSNTHHRRCVDSMQLHLTYLNSLGVVNAADWAVAQLEAALLNQLGDHEGIEGCITWKRTRQPQVTIDEVALREAHPEIYAQYLSPGSTSRSVDIHFYRAYPVNSF